MVILILLGCSNIFSQSAERATPLQELFVLKELEVQGARIAVLGDMLELGEESQKLHRESGRVAVEAGIDRLLCIGEESKNTIQGALDAGMPPEKAVHCLDHQQLLDHLLRLIKRGDAILFKGSRGMELEKTVVGLKGTAFKSN